MKKRVVEFRDWNSKKELLIRKGSMDDFNDMFDLMTKLHNDSEFIEMLSQVHFVIMRIKIIDRYININLN